MARKNSEMDSLGKMIRNLRSERTALLERLSEIESVFEEAGLAFTDEAGTAAATVASAVKKGTRKAARKVKSAAAAVATKGAKKTRKRTRGTFAVTAEESIVSFIKSCKTPPTTAQINAHWVEEGRGGKADNTLTKLTKAGTLIRENIEGQRGSLYKVA